MGIGWVWGGENDMFKWDLSVTGLFSVRSMYRALLNNNHVTYNKTMVFKGTIEDKDLYVVFN